MSQQPIAEQPRCYVTARELSWCPVCRTRILVGETITPYDSNRWQHVEGCTAVADVQEAA